VRFAARSPARILIIGASSPAAEVQKIAFQPALRVAPDRLASAKRSPPFSFPGAWLYCGDQATVRLVDVDEQPQTTGLRLEHFAFTATGLKDLMGRLPREGERYDARKVPRSGAVQINVSDPAATTSTSTSRPKSRRASGWKR
jgi:hypothetical protein